jgi:dienelactone hydrolase
MQSILRNVVMLLFCSGQLVGQDRAYDPMVVPTRDTIKMLDLTVKDEGRRRDIPIRVYYCEMDHPAPVVLFSHGLGGSRENNPYLGNHWAARGYVVVFVQHIGSDVSVWQGKPVGERMKAMQKAANTQNLLLRVKDVPVVLDQLERWNKADGHILSGRLNMTKIGMSGHSFGAVTTQAVSGQRTPKAIAPFTDQRITAAIAMSPSSPKQGTAENAFGGVKISWMVMTGTKDFGLVGGGDPESRMKVFPALPPGDKYELVLDKAEHSAFSDRPLPGDTERRNPNHHRAILALSTAFWDAWLGENSAAKTWLNGDGPRSVLEPNDRWQTK